MPEIDGGRTARVRAGMRASRRAFMLACADTPHGGGTLYEAVQAALAGLPATHRARIALETITEFRRTRSDMGAFAARFGLSAEDMDALFRRAMQIEAEG